MYKIFGVIGILLIGSAHLALAGPPFVTDDPVPVDYRHWEFYIASQDIRSKGDGSGTAPHFEINYGLTPNLQLHLLVPMSYDLPPKGAEHYGVGDIELGAKYRFIQETKVLPQVAVYPTFEVPTGVAHENLGNSHLQAFLPIWLQKSWGSWTIYGGAGYGINSFSGHQNWGFGGILLQKQVSPHVAIGAEVYHQTAAQPDFPNVGTAFNVGTVIDLNEQQHLLFSVGRSIDGPNAFQCYIAYQLTLGPEFMQSISHWFVK
jgi:hypothetical protein